MATEKIKPMLAGDGERAFNAEDWLWEQKYDGARILPFVNNSDIHLQARSGTDKTEVFPELQVRTRLPAILDGEAVSATGLSFQDSIQKRVNRSRNVSWAATEWPAKLMVFDVLEIDGKNVENLPLLARKEWLAKILIPTETVELAPWSDDGIALFENAKANLQEGIVGKSKSGLYHRDKREWLKVKCWQMGKFMVVGYTAGTGWRESTFGALVLADAAGKYVGEVGTGFNNNDLAAICAMFSPAPCPFHKEPEPATWVKPFAIKVRFLEYTNEGILRFPSFKGVI